ncbi:hypothetical protein B9Q09_04805 [Candidatus Marsarchaeota G2 archaeon ECH_B_SAG-C16]|uniref:Phosphoserine phosphatase n=2 Tax=Candidatus Marsarchaeota group 2 TaxID=2203771 RepID=A0A2R6B5H6_9ARCH|nr:MAG: hypothetical protein B9Q08_05720 [Candidatus Marsarchaeota G2 archaeon ECH_B_SAG-M15]PSN93914.1 MAG: hypothetical protein B9Q09_04805 [Candidatus Marsarchaeota G2 archaeon ECH_B_SAG-C16]
MLSGLDELEEKARRLQELIKQERDLASAEANKRDELNAAFKRLITEYKQLKNRRDDLIKTLRDVRAKKDVVFKELQQLHEKLKGRETEVAAIDKIDKQVQRLEAALQKAEWEYQTRSMSTLAAKNLEKEIEELEAKLEAAKKKQEVYKETLELKRQYDEKLNEFRRLKDQFRNTVSELDEVRSRAASLLAEAKKVKAEADECHQRYIQHANEVIKYQAELNAVRLQIREDRREMRQRSQFEQRARVNKVLVEKAAKAKEKLDKGEKLNFEELQALLLADELGGQQDSPKKLGE